MDGLDREFDRMITSEPFDYRHKYVRLHQVLGMLGLPFCFFWVYQLHLIWEARTRHRRCRTRVRRGGTRRRTGDAAARASSHVDPTWFSPTHADASRFEPTRAWIGHIGLNRPVSAVSAVSAVLAETTDSGRNSKKKKKKKKTQNAPFY